MKKATGSRQQAAGLALAVVIALGWAATGMATPTASMETRFGVDTGGACYAPCPFVSYTVSTSPHQYTATDGGSGVRTDEGLMALCEWTAGTKILAGDFNGICWEKIDLASGSDWSAESVADADAYWYEGSLLHGAPIAIKINGAVVPTGTCGALASGEWAWCNVLDTEGSGADASFVYVQLDDDANPESKAASYVAAIYGDGTHVRLASAAGSVAASWWEVAEVDVDAGTIELVAEFHASDQSDVVFYQAVKDIWTDINYTWTVTADTVEDGILDLRSTVLTTATDEHAGRGPQFAAKLKAGFSSATITMTATDLANGGSDDTAVVFTETSWSGSTDFYVDATLGQDGESLGTHAAAGWTSSSGDASAYYYQATVTAGKPDRVLANVGGTSGGSGTNVTILTEGTCGSLGGSEWCYGDVDSIGESRVYVQGSGAPPIHAEWSDGSIGEPFAGWNYTIDRMRGVPSGTRRAFFKCGETFSVSGNPAQWGAETQPTYIGSYGTCTGSNNPIISKGGGIIWNIAENGSPYTRDIVVEHITFTQTAGSSDMLVLNGKNALWSNIGINYAGTGSVLARGAGDYSWSLWWDWDASVTNASALYGLVDSNPVHAGGREIKGVAFVGIDWDHQGGASTSAPFRTNHHAATLFKHCKILRNNAAANPVLRINLSTGVYLQDNYLIGQGATSTITNGCGGSCGPGTSTSWLIDGDLWDMTAATGSPSHFDFDIQPNSTGSVSRTTPEGAFRIQNTIAVGGGAFVGMHFFRAPDLRIYNSTFYSEATGTKGMTRYNASNGSVACLKIVNCAMQATNNNAATLFADQQALYGTLEGTNLYNNTCDIGASANFVLTEGVTYANATTWQAATGKSGQSNQWATDPVFEDASGGDFNPGAGSPMIGSGRAVPTNPFDHTGTAWGSPHGRGALKGTAAPAGPQPFFLYHYFLGR